MSTTTVIKCDSCGDTVPDRARLVLEPGYTFANVMPRLQYDLCQHCATSVRDGLRRLVLGVAPAPLEKP